MPAQCWNNNSMHYAKNYSNIITSPPVAAITLISHRSIATYTTIIIVSLITASLMRIDTGQQLDIIYTTVSLITVTPKDGHTSMEIVKINDEHPNTPDDCEAIIQLIVFCVSRSKGITVLYLSFIPH